MTGGRISRFAASREHTSQSADHHETGAVIPARRFQTSPVRRRTAETGRAVAGVAAALGGFGDCDGAARDAMQKVRSEGEKEGSGRVPGCGPRCLAAVKRSLARRTRPQSQSVPVAALPVSSFPVFAVPHKQPGRTSSLGRTRPRPPLVCVHTDEATTGAR